MILVDHNKITIESFMALKQISEDIIVIQCNEYELTITGRTLVVSAMNKYEITIKGKIGGLQFNERDA